MVRTMNRAGARLYARSVEMVEWLDQRHRTLLLYWTILASLACGIRLGIGQVGALPPAAQLAAALPYALVVGAPIASLMLALHWFRDGKSMAQPDTRLAVFGRWRTIAAAEARRLPLYGVTGLMASLLLGILLNIPIRTIEFLTAMPTLGAAPPGWFGTLYMLMLADVVLLSSAYAVAFAAALRCVPLFPRLLAAIWGIDVTMQVWIAKIMVQVDGLPPAVAGALQNLLEGNLQKVLISMAIWLPYLILSKRVNLTFRHRIAA